LKEKAKSKLGVSCPGKREGAGGGAGEGWGYTRVLETVCITFAVSTVGGRKTLDTMVQLEQERGLDSRASGFHRGVGRGKRKNEGPFETHKGKCGQRWKMRKKKDACQPRGWEQWPMVWSGQKRNEK